MSIEQLLLDQKTLAQEIEILLRNFKKDGPSRKTPDYIKSKENDLNKKWKDFNELHTQLQEAIKPDHPYFIEDLYGKTKQLYESALCLIRSYSTTTSLTSTTFSTGPIFTSTICTAAPTSSAFGQGVNQPISSVATTSTMINPNIHGTSSTGTSFQSDLWDTTRQINASSHFAENRLNNFPKLPPIKIPKFSGSYKEWKSFIDIFTQVIDCNPYLSDVEKMQYLLYHIEGDAKKVISHLQLNNDNYNTALRLIQSRFNNSRKIITEYINTIMDAKKVEYRSQEDIIALYDVIRECLGALKNLNCHTEEWGPIIVCVAIRKLDAESLRLFEESLANPREMPSTPELLSFLEKRYQILDCIKSTKQVKLDTFPTNKKKSVHTLIKRSCVFCNKDHNLYQCTEFKKINVQDRYAFIAQKNLCTNCMAHKRSEGCKTSKSCFYCKKKHHTLLHRHNESIENTSSFNTTAHVIVGNNPDTDKQCPPNDEDVVTFHSKTKMPNVLLPTALVRLKNIFGQTEPFRALIDPGSQVSLITEEAVQNLKLQKERMSTTILGVGDTKSAKAHSKVKIRIQLQHQRNLYLCVEALVLPKLNSLLPDSTPSAIDITKYGNITLADPTYNIPGPIDLLLGADVYANVLLNGLKPGQPTAQLTKLGWILFGTIPTEFQKTNKVSTFLSLAEIDQKLEQFWEMEKGTPSSEASDNCTEHFKATHQRDQDGRYIVRLPFKEHFGELGQSRHKAIARLLQNEKKLEKSPNDLADYNAFLMEYLKLNHMSPARSFKGENSKVYYLPHHAVFKRESTTTKLRVVFDASCETESGLSLNHLLHKGKKIQQDLNQILLRWRKHRYVFTADIEKMFRQIKVAEEDRNYQRILWRQKPTEPIQEFRLNTVTYGTAPATFLAVQTLKQLAEDEGHQLPLAKKVLNRDFYIDDMLSGTDTKAEARQLQQEIVTLLKKGGFNLRKWTSNDDALLKDIPESIIERGMLEIGEDETIKALGIHWNPKQDEFQFKLQFRNNETKLTKRIILSKVATVFDPLGWLAPVTVTAKLIMQSLWKSGTDWDQPPPADITKLWTKLEIELQALRSIRIPRWIGHRTNQEIQLHGFCDASEKAYAAVIYSRTVDAFGKIHTTLLTAKTKVAPLKQKITLPRLELCGALLLAQLLKSTISNMELSSPKVFAWCDSEIALAWIAKNPDNWHTFVANRVNEIQSLFDKSIWRHISSPENPADIASRGISPCKLASHKSWWNGPLWLAQPSEAWPTNKLNILTNLEQKKTFKVFNATISTEDILRYSSYTRQVRIIAYCLRFIKNCKVSQSQRKLNYLTYDELKGSEKCIVKIAQWEKFPDELQSLQKNKPLKTSSRLLSLHPFLDADGILRVGGRLKNSNLSMDAKHQILLPSNHHLTNLIIDHSHHQTLHGGTQLTLNFLRAQFWIIDGKRVVQGRIHKCLKCVRQRQKSTQPIMGNLPAVRITPSPPFSHCGIDYAGPFLTKSSKGRGTKTNKGYISLFVCMVTKAIHLELVSDLTTDSFLAAYRRFVARRGNCKQIFSDNGTNFVGAKNKLDKELQLAISRSSKQIAESIANDGTEWKFIPAFSPHFGGLWEAGVKSVKGHLKRVLGETLLTYEEFTTILYQVEACLNSRPIGQHSSDPTDLEPLTPGHFLIGRPLLAPPEPDIHNTQIHQRWKLVTKLYQDIWKRWSQEYLSLLQQRSRWRTDNKNPSIGELVLVKEDILPPQKWSLGRIVQLHPGEDGVTRIVSVQYKNIIKKRPLNKLCQLPISIYNSEEDNADFEPITTMMTFKKSRKRALSKIQSEPELWSKPEHFDKISTGKSKRGPESCPTRSTKKTKIAPCYWASRLLHSTLLILYWLSVALAQDCEVFQPKSGFYIENLGSAKIKRGNLRLQVSFPTVEILDDQKHINSTWEQIKQMCDKTKKLTQITRCSELFRHLSTRRDTLLKSIDEILFLVEPKKRRRRGLLGRLLTSVFGVNEEVYTNIEVLEHNQQNLLHSTNQQMLLLNAKVNQSNFIIVEKLKHFDTRLSQVISSINEMATWYIAADHNRISIEVIATYLSAEDYYDELQEKYSHWLNAIHNHGHLLNFISLHEINTVIQNVSQKIGSNFLILSTPQDRLDVTQQNGTIILYGYLNIIETSLYDLIHVTPTPHMIEGTQFTVADIKSSTFAVDFTHQTYFTLEEQEFKSCSEIASHVFLCTPTIVYSIDNSPSCVVDEIYDRHPKTACEIRHFKLTGTIWKALMMKNTWLYVTNERKVVAIICKGTRRELLLNTTGIIHTADDCYLQTKEITLKPALDQTIEVINSHIKEVPPQSMILSFSKAPSVLQPGVLLQPNEQILKYSLEPETHSTILRKTLAIHSITATSTLLIICLAMCVWKYWAVIKMKLHRGCSKKRTTPREGRQPSPQDSIQQHFNRVLAAGAPQHVHI